MKEVARKRILFLNLRLGLIGMVLSALWIGNLRQDKDRPFDWTGFISSAIACSTIFWQSRDRL
jgi:hypothetical protein